MSAYDVSQNIAGPGLRLWNNLLLHLRDSELTVLYGVPPVIEDASVCREPRRLVTVAFRAPYKCAYLLTYLPTYVSACYNSRVHSPSVHLCLFFLCFFPYCMYVILL